MESFDKALWKNFLALNNAYAEVITTHGPPAAKSFFLPLEPRSGHCTRMLPTEVRAEQLFLPTKGLSELD